MSPPKRPPLPAILLANHLLDGEVVFWTGTQWSDDPAQAWVAKNDAQASALEAAGAEALRNNHVVDAYLVDVTLNAEGLPRPNHYREKIKTEGPTVRRDLGKQAGLSNLMRNGL